MPPRRRSRRARETVRRAIEGGLLFADFDLIHKSGERVKVSAILDNPKRWHNERFHDPLEPEYGGDDGRIAWANLFSGGRPYLFSHAHGGRRFVLLRETKTIRLAAGATHVAVDQTLDVLRSEGDLFDSADSIVRIVAGEMVPVTKDWLLDRLSRAIRYFPAGITIFFPPDSTVTGLVERLYASCKGVPNFGWRWLGFSR